MVEVKREGSRTTYRKSGKATETLLLVTTGFVLILITVIAILW